AADRERRERHRLSQGRVGRPGIAEAQERDPREQDPEERQHKEQRVGSHQKKTIAQGTSKRWHRRERGRDRVPEEAPEQARPTLSVRCRDCRPVSGASGWWPIALLGPPPLLVA